MGRTETVIEGTIQPDGTLVLDEKPKLSPGRVTVLLWQEAEIMLPMDDPFWQRMRAMWAIPVGAGGIGDGGATSLAELSMMREEWDEHQQAIEGNQDESRLKKELAGGAQAVRVYLDTNCIIYFVERDPLWWQKVVTRITAFRLVKDGLTVGDLSLAECFVVPFKYSNPGLESRYRAFFSDPSFRVLEITAVVCERAARIRATYPFKLPDAIHLATAIEHGCGLFLTNDAQLSQCTMIPVEILT